MPAPDDQARVKDETLCAATAVATKRAKAAATAAHDAALATGAWAIERRPRMASSAASLPPRTVPSRNRDQIMGDDPLASSFPSPPIEQAAGRQIDPLCRQLERLVGHRHQPGGDQAPPAEPQLALLAPAAEQDPVALALHAFLRSTCGKGTTLEAGWSSAPAGGA